MARNVIVINVDFRETRVALIEDGVIAELQIERAAHRSTVGNIVLGKVTRVLPGMQAAFIDVGQERAAFLHVEDLIRPDDFDAYLAGDAREGEKGATLVGEAAEGEDVVETTGVAAGIVSPAVAPAPAARAAAPREDADGRDGRGRRRRGRRGRGRFDRGANAEPGAPALGDSARDEALAAAEGFLSEEAEDAEELAPALADAAEAPETRASGGVPALLQQADGVSPTEEESQQVGGAQAATDGDDAGPDSDDGNDFEDSDGDEELDEELSSELEDDAAGEDDAEIAAAFAHARAADEDDELDEDEDEDLGDEDEESDVEEDSDGDEDDSDADEDSDGDEDEESEADEDEDGDEDEESDADEDSDGDEESEADEDEDEDELDEDGDDDEQLVAAAAVPAAEPPAGESIEFAGGAGLPVADAESPLAEAGGEGVPPRARVALRRRFRNELAAVEAHEAARSEADAEAGEAGTEGTPNAGDAGRRGRRRRRRGRAQAEPRFTVSDVEATPVGDDEDDAAEADAGEGADAAGDGGDARGKRRRRRGRRRRGDAPVPAAPVPLKAAPVADAKAGKRTPARVSRSVPISEVVREGDHVVVQISKEPIGTKGARVTSHVSLPGRYVVYLPTVEHIGISKRIGNARERARLRQTIEALKPPTGGLIVRTVAEGLTKKQLKADVGYLIKVWAEVAKRRESAKPADTLYEELDLVLKAARDLFTDEVDHIIIDDRDQHGRLCRFVEMFMPGRVKDIKLYSGEEPIFDAYGIEDEIKRALSRKVPLPSGGSLIVDQAEALTAIDVNTGRYVGKGSKDLEETALKTNLEAVDEIAYQLRFRNLGGLVILDLIDMERADNRERVWRSLEQKLAKDKAKTTINRISDLGLIEMTRKRTRESLGRVMHEACFYCDGTGHIQSRETIAYEILRQIRRDRLSLTGYSVRVHAHPAVTDFLKHEARDALQEAERRYLRRIELVPRQEYHIEQYDLQGR